MPKFIDAKEFRDAGYLQEVNRRFLHPLGLALTIISDDEGVETFHGVMDCRDDPEGMIFVGYDEAKVRDIDRLWAEREPARGGSLGFMIQDRQCLDGKIIAAPATGWPLNAEALLMRVIAEIRAGQERAAALADLAHTIGDLLADQRERYSVALAWLPPKRKRRSR